jgi:hypothetical protein
LPTLFRVLLCADVVVFVVAYLSPRPVIDFMGGTEGSPLEEAVGLTNDDLMWGAGLAFTILAVAAFVSAPRIGAQAPAAAPSGTRLDRRLTAFALASAFAWLLPTPVAQVEQYWRWSVERDLRGGRIERALAAMSARSPDDFPPHWDPPPHAFFEEDEPSIESILASILQQPAAGWVTERFVPKVFHGYYGEGDSYADRLEGLVAGWAEDRGEEEARALLELIAAHAGWLTQQQRRALDDLLARVRAGTRLYQPEASEQ